MAPFMSHYLLLDIDEFFKIIAKFGDLYINVKLGLLVEIDDFVPTTAKFVDFDLDATFQ